MLLLPLPLTATLLLLLSTATTEAARPRPHILKRKNPTFTPLSDSSLDQLVNLTKLDTILDYNDPKSALSKLLVPRAAGSANLTRLQDMVVDHFEKLNWHVEKDAFEAETPYGIKPFTNLIFTHDPDATRRLVLSAHLDSKFFPTHPEDQFIGATDSAAPCAMLLDLASALTPWLDARKQRVVSLEGGEEGRETQGETLQIVFFDGEEAFKDWTATDSIYGARHLADLWSQPTVPPTATLPIPPTPLSRISHLVLLDLLGAPNPVIRSFYKTTGWFFDEYLHAEERLGAAGFLWPGVQGEQYSVAKSKLGVKERSFFVPRGGFSGFGGTVGDDHEPFLHKGVPVVHLITVPFPSVWHTIKVCFRFSASSLSRALLTIDSRRAGRRRGARPTHHQSLGPHYSSHSRRVPRTRPRHR